MARHDLPRHVIGTESISSETFRILDVVEWRKGRIYVPICVGSQTIDERMTAGPQFFVIILLIEVGSE